MLFEIKTSSKSAKEVTEVSVSPPLINLEPKYNFPVVAFVSAIKYKVSGLGLTKAAQAAGVPRKNLT